MSLDAAKEWLISAQSDLRVIDAIREDAELTHMSAFHAQQAIEKVLKGYMELQGMEVPKWHKIASLLQKSGAECDLERTIVHQLDELYVESRYPGDMGLLPYGKPTLEDAKRFEEAAYRVYRWLVGRISLENGEN